jgi:hypothetical protein
VGGGGIAIRYNTDLCTHTQTHRHTHTHTHTDEAHRLVGGGAVLVLGRLVADPKVRVPLQGAAALAEGVQHNVAVARVEAGKV